jgi:guanylate kinase
MDGKLVIFSAPSGAGKTTIVHSVLAMFPQLKFSVSACSRAQRPGEVDGKDYYFLSEQGFRENIANNAFLEWEEVYPGNFYGTLTSELERIWKTGHHVVFDVDVKGGLNIKKKYPTLALSIFIMPPSLSELENRLRNRQTESEEALLKRLQKASFEIDFANEFDKIIINDNLERAIADAALLIRSFLGES